jgi:1-acyl-sn-glycerol-3-phosphate acyltransferase
MFVFLISIYTKLFLILVVSKKSERSHKQCIYVVNHPNVFDPMYLLSLLGKRVTVLITEHAFQVPVFGTLLRYTRQIQVASCGRDAYKEAIKRLQHGESILLFPEGDCNSGKGILPFHTGAVRLAMETKVPIVPIGIYLDPMKIWKRHTKIGKTAMIFTWYRYGWYGVTFGKEIYLKGSITNWSLVKFKTKQLRATILGLAHESKKRCLFSMYQGKRKVKRQFHSALRFSYRLVCFLLFARVH